MKLLEKQCVCCRALDEAHGNKHVLREIAKCQSAVHAWDDANHVVFESGKESMHILHRTMNHGEPFKILSVIFDTKLALSRAVFRLVEEAGWRIKSILRVHCFYDTRSLTRPYK